MSERRHSRSRSRSPAGRSRSRGRSHSRSRSRSRSPSNSANEKRVFVGGFDDRTGKSELEDLFYKYGRVTNVELHRDRHFAFIDFESYDDACDAVRSLNRYIWHGREIGVAHARDPRDRPPPRRRGTTGKCFNCGKEGHWARDCTEGDWRCGDRGHIQTECPKSKGSRSRGGSRSPSRSPHHSRSRSRSRSHSTKKEVKKDLDTKKQDDVKTNDVTKKDTSSAPIEAKSKQDDRSADPKPISSDSVPSSSSSQDTAKEPAKI